MTQGNIGQLLWKEIKKKKFNQIQRRNNEKTKVLMGGFTEEKEWKRVWFKIVKWNDKTPIYLKNWVWIDISQNRKQWELKKTKGVIKTTVETNFKVAENMVIDMKYIEWKNLEGRGLEWALVLFYLYFVPHHLNRSK